MRTTFNKALALALMIFLMASYTLVYAEQGNDLDEAYDELSFSMLSNEKANNITKNIDLSLGSLKAKYPEVGFKWISSNIEIVSINLADKAVITRPNNDTNVILTAILSKEGYAPKTKEFEIRILKRNENVVVTEDFDGIAEEEKGIDFSQTSLVNNYFSQTVPCEESEFLTSVVDDPQNPGNNVLFIITNKV